MAVARKMAKLCWSLVQTGSGYEPSRVYAQPTARLAGAISNASQAASSSGLASPEDELV